MRIENGDLTRPEVLALLNEHLANMRAISPPGSVHALDVEKLRGPGVSFWTAWDAKGLMGSGALKEIAPGHGEVKSMRTPAARRRTGAGRAMIAHIIGVARERNFHRLSLETGAAAAFVPAQTLYQSVGFVFCGPFGNYGEDPNSVFMTLAL